MNPNLKYKIMELAAGVLASAAIGFCILLIIFGGVSILDTIERNKMPQVSPSTNRLALVIFKNQLPRYGHLSEPNEHGFRVMPDAQCVLFRKSSMDEVVLDAAGSDAVFSPPMEIVIAQDEIRMIMYAPPTAEAKENQ